MAYSRVTREERNHIYRWRQAGLGVRAIADRLARAASSISRELARNTGRRGYRPRQAHHLAQERALRPGPRRFTEEVRLDAEARLREGWTPEIISGRARLEGRAWVCKETIYKHVYTDAKLGGDLWAHLPRSRRKRRRRCPRQVRPEVAALPRVGVDVLVERLLADPRPPLQTGASADDLWRPAFPNTGFRIQPHLIREPARTGPQRPFLRQPMRLLRPVAAQPRVPGQLTADTARRPRKQRRDLSHATAFLTPTVDMVTLFSGHATVCHCSPRVFPPKSIAGRVAFSTPQVLRWPLARAGPNGKLLPSHSLSFALYCHSILHTHADARKTSE